MAQRRSAELASGNKRCVSLTLVRPGKSIKVRVKTWGEKILNPIGSGEIPVVHPK